MDIRDAELARILCADVGGSRVALLDEDGIVDVCVSEVFECDVTLGVKMLAPCQLDVHTH